MTKSTGLIIGIIGIVIVGALAMFGWRMSQRNAQQQQSIAATGESTQVTPLSDAVDGTDRGQAAQTANASWSFTGTGWQVNGTPPSCQNPLLTSLPTDLTKVTSILYPGQTRGGNYKPHGGFRFDEQTTNSVIVSLPLDAQLVDGGRYLVGGETQYVLDFITNCGLMLRLGHLLVVSPDIQTIVDKFPAPKEGDSRTTQVMPPVQFAAGTTLATEVGIKKDSTTGSRNVFFDFGLFDLRNKNSASADSTWQAKHADDQSLAPYGTCWLTEVSNELSVELMALPAADSASGTTSDYCK
jgi:hypothetical protein